MSDNFNIKNGAFNSLYLDIPMYYNSEIDQYVEAELLSLVRPYNQEHVVHEKLAIYDENSHKFMFNFAAYKLETEERSKEKIFRTLQYKNALHTFSNSTICDILSFYIEVTNSSIETDIYKKNRAQARLAIACFKLLAIYCKQFTGLMTDSLNLYVAKNKPFKNEHIKILFQVKNAELKTNLYLEWLSVLDTELEIKIGLKIHDELLALYNVAKEYQDKCNSNMITYKDTLKIINATLSLLEDAEYVYTYVAAAGCSELLDICREISTELRVLERILKLQNYATTKSDVFAGYIYLDFASIDKNHKKKNSITLNLSVNARIGFNNFASLSIDALTKQVSIDTDALLKVTTELNENNDNTIVVNNVKTVCELCQKTLNSLTLALSCDKAVYTILTTISLIRYIIDPKNVNLDLGNINETYTMLQSILYYIGQTQDTIYVTRVTNGLLEKYDDVTIHNFISSLVSNRVVPAQIKALVDHTDNNKPVDYLHNRLYDVLKIDNQTAYQPCIKIYEQISTDDVLSVTYSHDLIVENKDIIKQNVLSLFIIDNLYWLNILVKNNIERDCNVFEAYECGMQAVYEKYPHMRNFFKTFYSFYIVGVMAYLLKDFNLPLQVLSSFDRFSIETVAKKLRKAILIKKQQEEQLERQKELDRLVKERNEERKRQQELEAQRLAEQKAAEEKERLRQLDLEEANKIMEELNKNAWAGFTVPQQQAAYVRYLQEGNDNLTAANLVKEDVIRRKEEEDLLFAQWEQEEQDERLRKMQEEEEAEEKRKEQERLRYKALCDEADQQYEDMRAGKAIFPNILLSGEEYKTAPLLNIYEIANLFPDMTSASKLMKRVYDAPVDVLPVDIISEELLRMHEIKSNQIVDPIDKEVMLSTKALANKHCVSHDRFTKLVELGMPIEQALIIPADRLAILTNMYKADKIVYDRKGQYIVCKGEYMVPVSYKELRELYIKHKKTKGDVNE